MHKIKIDRHMVRRVKTASGGCARNSPQLLLQQMARSADCHSNASVCYFILLHFNFFFYYVLLISLSRRGMSQ